MNVGLDMSLKSPAMAIWEKETNQWQLYAFSKKKTKTDRFFTITKDITLLLFPNVPKDISDAKRYKFIVDRLVKYIPLKSIILIEAYAYPNPGQSGYNFKLHELGGYLKVKLIELGLEHYTNVVSSHWKKQIVGKGNATKKDVLDHVQNTLKIDLLTLLNTKISPKGEVPCPVQDIADAICIAQSST